MAWKLETLGWAEEVDIIGNRERGGRIVKQQNKKGIKNKTTMEVYRVMCSVVYKMGLRKRYLTKCFCKLKM